MQKLFIYYVCIVLFSLQLQGQDHLELTAELLIRKTCQEQKDVYTIDLLQDFISDINNQQNMFIENIMNKINTMHHSKNFIHNIDVQKEIVRLLTIAIQIIDHAKKHINLYSISPVDHAALILIFEKKQQILQAKLQELITIQREPQGWFNKKNIQYMAIGLITISCAELLHYFYQYEPKAGKLYDAQHHTTVELTPTEQKQAIEHPFFQQARQYLLECLVKKPSRTQVIAKIKELKPSLDPKLHGDYLEAFEFIQDHQNFSRFDLLRKFGIFNLQEKAHHFRNLGLHILNSHPESQKTAPDKISWKPSDFPLDF
ncbi:MAG: hypothetical protein ACXWL5_02370 [Candidatus Chromulinivorax sp.]